MSNYRRCNKYLVTIIMVISLGINLFLIIQLRTTRQKIANSNNLTSAKLESAIRDTMYSIKELNETDSEELINNLKLSIQQLVLVYNSWVNLNQLGENSNGPLARSQDALETLKNTVVYYLSNQYNSNGGKLTNFDMVFLDRTYEKLDRLLVIYNNIEERIDKIGNTNNKNDGGLCRWADGMDEVSRLYRHSRIPNEHPKYLQPDSVLARIDELFPILKNFQGSKEIKETVQIKDGVHYYEISYYNENELSYLIWMDAVDGSLRFFENYTNNHSDKIVLRDEAMNIAKNFMSKLKLHNHNNVKYNISVISDKNSKNIIYAFQFTPVLGETTIVSDSVNISVSSRGGNITKYSNNFSNTKIPDTEPVIALEDIEERYKEQFTNMEYDGLSVIRSFYTYYRPVVTYNYKSTEKKDTTELHFDVVTGNQVYESYSVYEPISCVAIEGCY